MRAKITGMVLSAILAAHTAFAAVTAGTIPVQTSDINPGLRSWTILPVEFLEDDDPYTTGTGKFLEDWLPVDDTDTLYSYDAPPHNEDFFLSRLQGINHYWETVTDRRISVKASPEQVLSSVTVDREIRYYNPATQPDSVDFRLAELVVSALRKYVTANGEIPAGDAMIIYHAGVGQDFDFSDIYDSTPFDIPSFYYDETFLRENLPDADFSFLSDRGLLTGIVLPEMQNQLGVDIGLKGTEILLTGFLLGLPALYDTGSGRSYAGIFGLMDQGSNNAAGLVPIYPSAYERMLLGIEDPTLISWEGDLRLLSGRSYKFPLSSSEYFLFEYRHNTGVWLDSLLAVKDMKNHMKALEFLADSLNDFDIVYSDTDTSRSIGVTNYDVTLPTNGLLIWHVQDPWSTVRDPGDNPNGGEFPFLDLVEADGGDDIGKDYGFLYTSVNQGYKYDMWFEDNPGYAENNPRRYSLVYSDDTYPNTRTFNDVPGGLTFRNFRFTADTLFLTLEFEEGKALRSFENAFLLRPYTLNGGPALLGLQDSSAVIMADGMIHEIFNIGRPADPQVFAPYFTDSTHLVVFDREEGILYTTVFDPGTLTADPATFRTFYLPEPPGLNSRILVSSGRLYWTAENSGLVRVYDTATGMLELPLETDRADLSDLLSRDGMVWASGGKFLTEPGSGTDYQAADSVKSMAGLNDSIICVLASGGLQYFNASTGTFGQSQRTDIMFGEVVPLYADDDGSMDLAAVGNINGKDGLFLIDGDGDLFNGWPVYGDYRDLRIMKKNGELRIAAEQADGRIDIFSRNAERLASNGASADACSFFYFEDGDVFNLVSNGTIWYGDADASVWPAADRNSDAEAWYTDTPAHETPSQAQLIDDGLIYNYPNPVTDGETRFRYRAGDAESLDIYIYDYAGKFVEHLSQTPVKYQVNELLWKTDELSSGVYIARISVRGAAGTETYVIKPAVLR